MILQISIVSLYLGGLILTAITNKDAKKINNIIKATNIKNTNGLYPMVKKLNKDYFNLIIPEGISFDKVKDLEPVISTALKKDIQINNDNFKYSLTFPKPKEFPEVIPFEFIDYKSEDLKFPIGYDENNQLIWCNLTKNCNMLVNGVVGSGKSVFIHNLMLQLNHNYDMDFTLIDMKAGVELIDYKDLKSVKSFTYKQEKVLSILEGVYDEINSRLLKIRSKGYRNTIEYNRHCADKMKYHVVVFEELMPLGKDKAIMGIMKKCLSLGRASGIYFVTTAQRFDSTVIDGAVKANNDQRVSFKVGNRTDSLVILDEVGAELIQNKGRCLYSCCGEIKEVQCFYVNTETELKGYISKFPIKQKQHKVQNINLSDSIEPTEETQVELNESEWGLY